jgi:hypothetical protein
MAFDFQLQQPDGTPADPATLASAVPNWKAGDVIPLGGGKALRVVAVLFSEDPSADAILIVEPA